MKQMQQELDATRAQLEQLRTRQDGYATLEKVLGTIDTNLSSLAGQASSHKTQADIRAEPSRDDFFGPASSHKTQADIRAESKMDDFFGPASSYKTQADIRAESKMDASNFPAVFPPAPNPDQRSLRAYGPQPGQGQWTASGWKTPERKRFNGKLLPDTQYPAGRTPHGLSSKEDKLVNQEIDKAKREYVRKVKEAQRLEEQRNKWMEWQRSHTPNREQKAIIARADKLYQDKLYEVEKADAQIQQMESWQAAGSVPKNLKTDIARKTARVPKSILKPGQSKRVRFLDTLGTAPPPPPPNFG